VTKDIFVRLLDEGVDVWRPVVSEHIHDNVYRIADQPYDRNIETWEFAPGDEVIAEVIDSDDGPFLVAVGRPSPEVQAG
jgi:hypothetical protein